MPTFCKFDTQSVHPPGNPQSDTRSIVTFPRPFVSRPRLAHGLRELDIDKSANIRAKSTMLYYTKASADCHITTWADTTLYSGILDVFGFESDDLNILTGEHMRSRLVDPDDTPSVRVKFQRPFLTPPKVVVFLNYIDLDKDHNWRLRTTATDIDVNGFTLNIESWGDTILYGARAGWIAYPENYDAIFSTSVNTIDACPLDQPQLQHSRTITFGNVEFLKNPNVFVALNYLDVDCKANLRINAYVDSVLRTALTWHINTWDDTILHAAGASIIAFI